MGFSIFFLPVKRRCRLSWLTNSALVYEPNAEGGGGGCGGSQQMSTAVNMEPKLTWDLTLYLTYGIGVPAAEFIDPLRELRPDKSQLRVGLKGGMTHIPL